ncbi:MAG: hypothetical protein EBX59_12850, partial [Betaproteobacteria bacterium]|nr:hypothetical protein [Betaproteobacteria bacterium]
MLQGPVCSGRLEKPCLPATTSKTNNRIAQKTNTVCGAAALLLFFVGFNVLEVSLPSQVSKLADPALR